MQVKEQIYGNLNLVWFLNRLLLYSGTPYIEVVILDWNARSSTLWFTVRLLFFWFNIVIHQLIVTQCTATNFADFDAFGLIVSEIPLFFLFK